MSRRNSSHVSSMVPTRRDNRPPRHVRHLTSPATMARVGGVPSRAEGYSSPGSGYCGCRCRVEWASLDGDNFLGRLWCRSCMAAHDTRMFVLFVGISLTAPGPLCQALPLERGSCGKFLCCRGIPSAPSSSGSPRSAPRPAVRGAKSSAPPEGAGGALYGRWASRAPTAGRRSSPAGAACLR
jgi:hypothetical protein